MILINAKFSCVLIEPLQTDFMLRALTGGVLVAAICAVAGTWVVVRGMAFLGGGPGPRHAARRCAGHRAWPPAAGWRRGERGRHERCHRRPATTRTDVL
ncbi:metal ABC transporter permease [Glutamicibacter creatinolyticus]|uniref:metal ABC transporter permease n=1 Tax=Glutamicibacter creatinolyticus TaxID=162496 RepID=UPI0033C5A2A0